MSKQCEVTLKHFTPLHICAEGVRTCWMSGDKSDTTEKWICTEPECNFETSEPADLKFNYCGGFICPKCGSSDISQYIDTGEANRALIDKVGNKFKHASTLEHLTYNFQISGISRACLQELARHRIASLSVKSTRYTLKELKSETKFLDFNNPIG